MTDKLRLKAKKRTVFGRKVKNLKKDGLIAANLYGKGESTALELDLKEVKKAYQEAGDTGVVYLEIDDLKRSKPALFTEVKILPVKNEWEHVVFHEVSLKEKIEAMVPVVLIGENKVPETVVVSVKDEVLVEALPTDLPKEFEIDISELIEPEQAITFDDLKYDRDKVRLVIGEEEGSEPVVILQKVKEEAEEELEVSESDDKEEVEEKTEEEAKEA